MAKAKHQGRSKGDLGQKKRMKNEIAQIKAKQRQKIAQYWQRYHRDHH